MDSTHKPFDYTTTLLVGFGFLGISVIWPIFNQYIPIFLQAGNPQFEAQLLAEGRTIPDVVGFGLAPSLALFIMTWDNLVNVFVQPWVGAKSDRTWNRFGRRKGWILLGVPLAVVGFVWLPFAQTAVSLAVFILITNFGMAIFRSPTVAWLGDLYRPQDRSQANGLINLMGGIGGLLAFFAGGVLFENFGRSAPFIGGAVLLVAACTVVLWGVKEPKQLAVSRDTSEDNVLANLQTVLRNPNRNLLLVLLAILFWFISFSALETGLSSFGVFTLGLAPGTASIYAGSVSLAFLVFAVPAGFLGSRYGRGRMIQVGLLGLTFLFLVSYFLIQGTATFVGVLLVAGLLWACINVNSLPLVYDYGGDEGQIGAFTGLYYFASQLAAVIGPTLGGITVEFMDNQYRWLFPFSTLFMALAWIIMRQIKTAQSSS